MRKMHGLTMVELLVTLVIAAVLVTLAAPSFLRLIKSNAMSGAVNSFMADMRMARSEAIRRGGRVVMCRSDNPEDAAPACSTAAGTIGWASGWVVFQDLDGDGTFSAGDKVIHVQGPLTSIDSVVEAVASNATVFTFTGTGRLSSSALATQLQFGGPGFDTPLQRIVCVPVAGRARIAGDGSATCGANKE